MASLLRSLFGSLRTLRGGRLAVAGALALGGLLIVSRMLVSLHVGSLWFASVGYADVYWRRLAWSWGVRGAVSAVVAVALFVNLRLVVSTLGAIQIKRRFGNLEIAEQLPRSYALWSAAALSALVGLWFGGSVAESMGVNTLVAFVAPAWGVRDPIFGLDLSFYVFHLPLLRTAVTLALFVAFMVFTASVGGYAATGALGWGRSRLVLSSPARMHLGWVIASFLLLVAARLWLSRYLLLLDGTSGVQGIFGYTDAEARLSALGIMAGVTLAAAGGVAWGSTRNRLMPVALSLAAVGAGSFVVLQLYPSLVQRFRVEPNELARETPFIAMNIEFTRDGFGLRDLEQARFAYAPPETMEWDAASAQLRGLPVWAGEPLLAAYRQLEARFRYYDFSEPALDRYPVPGGERVVAIAAREVDPAGIEDPNWQNLHLREQYLAGMGAVASVASDRTPEGQPITFLQNIPPEFLAGPGRPEGVRLDRSAVYFGIRPQQYAILNPGPGRFLAPDSSPGRPGVDFPEGIPLSSPFRMLSFAWALGEPNLLFASEVTGESRIVLRREVTARARAIFPQLRFPEPAYPVVHEGRIVWMLEGFTVSRSFPLAAVRELEADRPVAYVRNAARITVDGVTGDVTFYRMPQADPVLAAYDRAFPGLFRPLEDMPEELRAHLRYPRRWMSLQAEVLRQYHQETPQQFHAQSDVWTSPTELGRGELPIPYQPEYGLITLPGENVPTFVLKTAFVPAERQNLTAMLAGRVEPDGRNRLFLYQIAVEDQVPGPRQVEALIEQDPVISQQLSLWRSGGSQVWTGHLHVVPVGETVAYMEALFLAAATDAIPELRRFVVSDGVRVAMEPTLEEAVAALAGPRSGNGTGPVRTLPQPASGDRWPDEALDLLRRAQARLRQGDWAGFGSALGELETMLQRWSGPAPGAPNPAGPPP